METAVEKSGKALLQKSLTKASEQFSVVSF
jgi:hypothetical protein